MAGRDEMLKRIRKALGRPTEPSGPVPRGITLPPVRLHGVMPPIAPQDLVPKFEEELRKLAGMAYRASSASDLDEILGKIFAASGAMAVVLSRNPLLRQIGLAAKLRNWGKSVNVWPASTPAAGEADDRRAACEFAEAGFSAAVGFTGVEFVLAETGSLILTSQTEGSQIASLAPPVHVALYRRNQLFASLDDVLERLTPSFDPDRPATGRSIVFVTGVSRTADIEQILIRGVHGPREVHAILVEEGCLV